jgi:hypothetical protein
MTRRFGIPQPSPTNEKWNPEVAPPPSEWPYIDEDADRYEGANRTFFMIVAAFFITALVIIGTALVCIILGWVRF